jgi:glycosyltransferase involved in cell wall biosynthesis
MRVLVVLAQPPVPEGGAPSRCAVALLRGLQAHGADVRALAARQYFAVAGDPPDDLRVDVVDVDRPEGTRRLKRFWLPRGELAGGEFGERVAAEAREADVVHLEETATSWADRGVSTPSLVHIHYLARGDRSFGAPWRKQFRDVLEFTLAERAAMRRHRYLVASSPVVADAVRQLAPLSHVSLAPLALDPRYYAPAPLDGAPVAGVIGTAVWPPTASALERLTTRVWPLVRRSVPQATLLVAGRGTEALRADAGEGIEVVGEVASAPDFLRRLSVLLYPVARGSGVKVKVLEAIASGVPVVTTAAGAEGIGPSDGGVVVAETDEELASAAVSILTDARERRQRGAAARASFESRFTPERATEPLLDLYRRMAG